MDYWAIGFLALAIFGGLFGFGSITNSVESLCLAASFCCLLFFAVIVFFIIRRGNVPNEP